VTRRQRHRLAWLAAGLGVVALGAVAALFWRASQSGVAVPRVESAAPAVPPPAPHRATEEFTVDERQRLQDILKQKGAEAKR